MQNRNALAVLGRSGNPVFRGNAFAPDANLCGCPGSGANDSQWNC